MARGQTLAIGAYREWVTIQTMSPAVPDGDGGYTSGWTDAGDWAVDIRPASVASLERLTGGTVLTVASHVLTGRYRPEVTRDGRVRYGARTFHVLAVITPLEARTETIAICQEIS